MLNQRRAHGGALSLCVPRGADADLAFADLERCDTFDIAPDRRWCTAAVVMNHMHCFVCATDADTLPPPQPTSFTAYAAAALGRTEMLQHLCVHQCKMAPAVSAAAHFGHLDCLLVLDQSGRLKRVLALHHAIKRRDKDMVAFLVKQDLVHDPLLCGPAVDAVDTCDLEIVQMVCLYRPGGRGGMALAAAAALNRCDIVALLRQRRFTWTSGDLTNHTDKISVDTLRFMCSEVGFAPTEGFCTSVVERGRLDLVRYLCDEARVFQLGHNTLRFAAQRGHVDLVRYLCDRFGVDHGRCPVGQDSAHAMAF